MYVTCTTPHAPRDILQPELTLPWRLQLLDILRPELWFSGQKLYGIVIWLYTDIFFYFMPSKKISKWNIKNMLIIGSRHFI